MTNQLSYPGRIMNMHGVTIILGLQPHDKAAMLVVNTIQSFFCMKIEFSSQWKENVSVLDHQHGHCDITCKPAILVSVLRGVAVYTQ